MNHIYKLLLLATLYIGLIPSTYSAHLVGTDGSYTCLGSDNYELSFSLFMEPSGLVYGAGGNADVDDTITVAIYDMDNPAQYYMMLDIARISERTITNTYSNTCTGTEFSDSMFRWDFTKTVNLPANTNGYRISYWRCCRPDGLVNIPDKMGLGVELTIPGSSITCNSSPSFNTDPVKLLCLNEVFDLDLSVTDPDGDSLSYSLAAPYVAGSNAAGNTVEQRAIDIDAYNTTMVLIGFPSLQITNATNVPPFSATTYNGGYSGTNPFGSNNVSIDQNGRMTGTPDQVGNYYVVGIEVEEWRNGVQIGSIRRDIPIVVVDCNRLKAQVDLSLNNGRSCDSVVTFDNISVNATTASWDFGIGSAAPDATDLNPTFAFPGPGDYNITLIAGDAAYPGCFDTTTAQITILQDANADFTFAPVCNENKAIFTSTSTVDPNGGLTDLRWEFTGSDQSNNAIDSFTYTLPGTYNVLLAIEDSFGCTDSNTQAVTVGGSTTTIVGTKIPNQDTICAGTDIEYSVSGGSDYTFYLNGASVQTGVTNYTYAGLNNGDAIMIIADPGTSCSDTLFDTITVITNPDLNAMSDLNICLGDGAFFTASGSNITTYQWLHNNHSTNFQSIPSSQLTDTITYTYQVRAISSFGCSDTDSIHVNVHALPIVGTANDHQICSGAATTLGGTYSGSATVTTWDWNNGATDIQNPSVSPLVDTRYLLTLTDSNGCSDTSSVMVRIGDFIPPLVQDSFNICKGDSITMLVTSGQNFSWKDSAISEVSTDSFYTYLPTQNTFIEIMADDNSGVCLNGKDTVIVIVNDSAEISFQHPASACLNSNVTINTTIDNAVTVSSWSWSNGSIIDSIPLVAMKDTTFTLQTTTNNGCTSNFSTSFTVGDYIPSIINNSISSTRSNTDLCLGDSIILALNEVGATVTSWTDSNGTVLGSTDPLAFVPSPSDNYPIILNASNGSCTGSDTIIFTITDTPTATIVALDPNTLTPITNNQICENEDVLLSASGGDSYQFFKNAVQLTSTDSTVLLSNIQNGDNYIVTARNGGCPNSVAVDPPFEVFSPANVVITSGRFDTVCFGDNATIIGDTSNADSIWWTVPTSTQTISGNSLTGIYTPIFGDALMDQIIYLHAVDSGGICPEQYDSMILHVDNPVTQPDLGLDITACNQDTLTISTAGKTFSSGQFTIESQGRILENPNSLFLSNLEIGNTSSLIYTASNGPACPILADTLAINITVSPISINAGNDSIVCPGVPFQLNGNIPATGGTSQWYQLVNGSLNPISTTNDHQPIVPQLTSSTIDYFVYEIEISACNDIAYDTVQFSNLNTPIAISPSYVYLDEPGKIPVEATMELNDLTQTISWEVNSESQTDTGNLIYTVSDSGMHTFIVYATDTNQCQSSDTVAVIFEAPFTMYFPTAFTPQGLSDGENDSFGPIGNMVNLNSYEMTIFDRWGQIVFTTTNLSDKWDGLFMDTDKLCESGQYAYHVKHTVVGSNEVFQTKGGIILLR